MAQTSYALKQDNFMIGQKADSRFDFVQGFGAEGQVAFGRAVTRGTNGEFQCKQVTSAGDKVLGIAIIDTLENGIYEDKDMVNVVRSGAVVVNATVQVNAGDDAYATATGDFAKTGTGTLVGTFTKTTDGANELTIVEFDLV